MPLDKYKAFYEIVKMLINFDLTQLRGIEKEFKILTKVKSKIKIKNKNKKKTKKSKPSKGSAAQKRARAEFAMRVRRGDFR